MNESFSLAPLLAFHLFTTCPKERRTERSGGGERNDTRQRFKRWKRPVTEKTFFFRFEMTGFARLPGCRVARKRFQLEKEGGARRKRGGVGGDIPRDALGKTEHTHTAANDRGRETKKERGERIRRDVGNP